MLRLLALVGLMALAPAAETPSHVIHTVWKRSGARSWTECSEFGADARNQGQHGFGQPSPQSDLWARRAKKCPHVPEVLALAARIELQRRFDVPELLDESTDLGELEADITESRRRALEWIARAVEESRRRGDDPPRRIDYWRGRALMAEGDFEQAQALLRRSLERGDLSAWRIRMELALCALYLGDLDRALAEVHRSRIDAPTQERTRVDHVFALVLDRAGDAPAALRAQKRANDRSHSDEWRNGAAPLELTMPMHERIYFRALRREARRDRSGALRHFKAYLARKEPAAPERRLAERHVSELEKGTNALLPGG